MSDPTNYPKLRWPLDIRKEKIENQEVIIINCPIGISKEPLVLKSVVAPLLARFDGTLSIDAIAAQFSQYGINREIVRQLVDLLDSNLFLNSNRFDIAQREITESFATAPIREAALAGLSYPADPKALKSLLDGYLLAPLKSRLPKRALMGLVSPHIDYRRGGISYGMAYQAFQQQKHDLYLLMGTAHQYSPLLFHPTAKDFRTPLGNLNTDATFIQKLAERYGYERSFKDELLHRREHSLELQTPFLKRVTETGKIVPILVGSFHHMVTKGKLPETHEPYESFITALTDIIKSRIESGTTWCLIAGVDMAHVGKQFGDKESLTDSFIEEIGRRDAQYLETIVKHDKKALFEHIAEDEDRRRICGFPTMYTALDLFERLGLRYHAEVLDYRQAVDRNTECMVTFAGVGLYAN